jgi:hypothetical protein
MSTSLYQTPGTQAAITITLASLATSATLVVGRASTVVSSGNWSDALVSGKITTGTSPTGGEIDVYVWAQEDDTPTYPDSITGTDAAKTFASTNVRDAALVLARVIGMDTTSNQQYEIKAFSVASLFGGVLPKRWGIFVTHSSGVNLNATGGNHEIVYLPQTWTNA